MEKRVSLIIYFKAPKALKFISKVSEIVYFNKKRKYAIIYCSKGEQEAVTEKLKEIKLIRKVEESMLDNEEYQIDFDVQ
jgi:uncharacterized protein YlbG (UPF0298 family)